MDDDLTILLPKASIPYFFLLLSLFQLSQWMRLGDRRWRDGDRVIDRFLRTIVKPNFYRENQSYWCPKRQQIKTPGRKLACLGERDHCDVIVGTPHTVVATMVRPSWALVWLLTFVRPASSSHILLNRCTGHSMSVLNVLWPLLLTSLIDRASKSLV